MLRTLIATIALLCAAPALAGSTSVFLSAPDDPAAIKLAGKGDGRTDDSDAIQRAIDAAAKSGQGGIVFVPSGRYRVTRTIFVRPAVRIYGVGPTRPVFVLAPRTPGFDHGVKTMFAFTGGNQYQMPHVPVPIASNWPMNDHELDANSATFYTAMANVDFEIGAGNPGAAAVRQRGAQHSFLRHIDFRIGSGFAGIYMAGNIGVDLRFFGGRYGIVTEKTSPAWQYSLLDSSFSGQRDAAIREHEAQLTLANVRIANTPVGIEIDKGWSDQLYGRDVQFLNVSNAALLVSNEDSAFTQVTFERALADGVPVFARMRDSGKTFAAPARRYGVSEFVHGLVVPAIGAMGHFDTRFEAAAMAAPLPEPARALRPLPPVSDWYDVRDAGARGDDAADDTAAIQQAIDTHRTVYFPMGHYRVTQTIRLRPDSVVIGLHPSLTQLILPEDLPAWRGVGEPLPLLASSRGGDDMIFSIGLQTGALNPRATALLWRADTGQVDDVKILGGAGTTFEDGHRLDYNDPRIRQDGQYPSIMVQGGGGTFASVWSANTLASAGLSVAATSRPATLYQMSVEHHFRAEIILENVENWEFVAPQTEQEVRDGVDAVSLDIRGSRAIRFDNYHGYRVTRSIKPAAAAVRLTNSAEIGFRNVHVNAESGYAYCQEGGCGTYLRASKFPFENMLLDVASGREVREREFAALDIAPAEPQPAGDAMPVKVERLASGFWSIGGAAVDREGAVLFVDRYFQRIWRWSPARGSEIVRDAPLDPVNLAVDGKGYVMVLSSAGPEATVYAFHPSRVDASIKPIEATPVRAGSDAAMLFPANLWVNGEFRDQIDPATYQFATIPELLARQAAAPKAKEFVSPDGTVALPAFPVVRQGPPDYQGWRWSDSLDTYGFVRAKPGERLYFTSGAEDRTYSGIAGAGGSITGLRPFANRGGESVAAGPDGRVYVAKNGQVWVYDGEGKAIGRIDVPERPIQLIFGGEDGHTLFILTQHSLYAARP